jgi:hypothetical protein
MITKRLPYRTILLLLITTTFSFGIFAQAEDSVYHERLYYTCKVWGHAKYYHSRIAKGEVDWDNVLLNILPEIKNSSNNHEFNDFLLLMLQQAGETQTGSGVLPEIPDSLNNNIDLSWIYNPIFSNDVSAALDTIFQRFRPQPNVYIKPSNLNHPDFSNDNFHYTGVQFPNEYIRILSVFRFWNIINYFFPYKYIMDQDWDTSFFLAIPNVVNASTAVEYHLAMRAFTSKIDDTHAYFNSSTFNNWKGLSYTPFLARFIEGKIVVTKVHSSISELTPGNIIKKIDGFEIDDLRDSLRKYSFGSNDICIERNMIDIILSGAAGNFSLTILNETGEHTFNLLRGNFFSTLSQDNTPYWREITQNGCRFGIIHMGNLTNNHFPQIINRFHTVDAIIFDIRNYPNGTLWTFANYLFDAPIHIANFTFPDLQYPGRLYWQEEVIGQGHPNPPRKQVMILFDERTQSQAEYTCMGLEQIPGSIKIGSTTAAADGNVALIYLPGGISVYATFLGTYYPDYTPTQRIGIIPDYEIRPTIQGIRENRDEVLEFALNCVFVGIEDITNNEEIKVFPNPTKGELRIENGELLIDKIEVFDMIGRTVAFQKSITSSTHQILNTSNLNSGIYFVKISTKQGEIVKKVVKQ